MYKNGKFKWLINLKEFDTVDFYMLTFFLSRISEIIVADPWIWSSCLAPALAECWNFEGKVVRGMYSYYRRMQANTKGGEVLYGSVC